ncbi:MAG: TAXI family TRAP transporter solute-binding subunit [Chloroflexi bacterium]|nr:TAXI family TRAP transporter solute-binding subunit [Chloroflexota bacterium]
MKRFLSFFILVLVLTGCATPAQNASEFSTPTPPQSVAVTPQIFSFKIASGGDDDWKALGAALSAQITQNVPNVKAEIFSTDSVMENLKLLTSGKVGMAFGYDYHAVMANEGKLASVFPNAQPEKISVKCGVEITRMPFPDYSQPVRIVAPLYEQPLFLVTTSNSKVAALSDLKGRRVATGLPQSVTEELAGYVLKALEISEGDFFRASMGLEEALSALTEEKIDAFFWSGRISDLAGISSANLIFLPITNADAETVMRGNPDIFHIAHIPAGQTPSIHNDTQTIAVTFALLAMQDFPADIAEKSLKAFEKRGVDEDLFLSNLAAAKYLHEGAAAYFANIK